MHPKTHLSRPNTSPPGVPPLSPQIIVEDPSTSAPKGYNSSVCSGKTKTPIPLQWQARYSDITDCTVRLVRPEGRMKREGREVAGIRRLGVLHCHSAIIDIILGFSQKICCNISLRWRIFYATMFLYTQCKHQGSYKLLVNIIITQFTFS